MFLVLGLVLVFVVGIGFYFVLNLKQDKIKIETEKSAELSFSSYNLNYFLENCFKKLASEGVDYVSLLGGTSTYPISLLMRVLLTQHITFMKTEV